jgi:hypothetical protein
MGLGLREKREGKSPSGWAEEERERKVFLFLFLFVKPKSIFK